MRTLLKKIWNGNMDIMQGSHKMILMLNRRWMPCLLCMGTGYIQEILRNKLERGRRLVLRVRREKG